MLKSIILTSLILTSSTVAAADKKPNNYPPNIPDAEVEVYKTIDDVKLNIYMFFPEAHTSTQKKPAIVFFFGGGWKSGTPIQFVQHCKHLASRGMVAMAADYRVRDRQDVTVKDCVADAKSTVRWIRKNANRLGVDPQRIAAGGGSAGGHIAACTGTLKDFDEPEEDLSVSSVPNAMALFNPVIMFGEVEGRIPVIKSLHENMDERLGTAPERISPYHHVVKGIPPTIIFHGTEDRIVLYWSAEFFEDAMKKQGNICELVSYENQEHGFFNYRKGKNIYYDLTIQELDRFLVGLGYLAEPSSSAP